MAKNNNKTIKIKQRKEINIAAVVFLFVVIYLAVTVFLPLTRTQAAIYQVPTGKVYAANTYKGLCIRTEKIFYAQTTGYINYYFNEGDRVAKFEDIYSVSTDKSIYDYVSEEDKISSLDSDEVEDLKDQLNTLLRKADSFADYKDIDKNLLTSYRRILDKKVLRNLNEIIRKSGILADFNIVQSECSGIISYQIDEFSFVTLDTVSWDMFTNPYVSRNVYSGEQFNEGSSVYKMITEDDWKIVVQLDNDTYNNLKDKSRIAFSINNDQELTTDISFFERENINYAVLYLKHYACKYTDQRFVTISFNVENTEGYKIPVSSVTYKDFYRIPVYYFQEMTGPDKITKTGLILDRGENSGFLATDIFLKDDKYYYVSADAVGSEEYILSADGSERSMIYLFLVKLEGVYNVNSGYAKFKQIERLESIGDYLLVKKGTPSGISLNDHIALNADSVTEGAVIY